MDIIEFAEKWGKIWYLGGWKVGLTLQPYEKEYLLSLRDNPQTITAKSRQMHFSTLLSVHMAHFLIFNEDKRKNILFISPIFQNSIDMMVKVRETISEYYRHGLNKNPEWVIYQKNKLSLSNGNGIFINSATSDAIKGMTVAETIIDEAAFIRDLEPLVGSIMQMGNRLHMVSSLAKEWNFFNDILNTPNGFKKSRVHYTLSIHADRYRWEGMDAAEWNTEMEVNDPPKYTEKNKALNFRISEELSNKIDVRCVELNMSLSEYLRKLVTDDLNS